MLGNTINQNVIYQDDEYSDSANGSKKKRKNKRGEHYGDEGSENAPDSSGFLSDDGDQERIVNESSLYNEDDFNGS